MRSQIVPATQNLQHSQLPAHMYQEPARYHSLGNGHVRAISVFGPELDAVHKQLRDAHQQQQLFATQNVQHSTTMPLRALQPSELQQEKPNISPSLQHPGTRTTSLPKKIKPSEAPGRPLSTVMRYALVLNLYFKQIQHFQISRMNPVEETVDHSRL